MTQRNQVNITVTFYILLKYNAETRLSQKVFRELEGKNKKQLSCEQFLQSFKIIPCFSPTCYGEKSGKFQNVEEIARKAYNLILYSTLENLWLYDVFPMKSSLKGGWFLKHFLLTSTFSVPHNSALVRSDLHELAAGFEVCQMKGTHIPYYLV